MRQVIADLAPHALHLQADHCQAIRVARMTLHLAGDHRQRRLETVRQIACARQRAAHRVFAMVEQRVQIVHEGLHFLGKGAREPVAAALANPRQARAQQGERREPAAHVEQARGHAGQRNGQRPHHVAKRVVQDAWPIRVVHDEGRRGDAREHEQTHGPQQGAREQSPAQRERRAHDPAPTR